MEQIILDVKNIEKKYKNERKTVDNISFSVKKGDIFGFLGPNGAGKTTTIRIILGLLKADKGEVYICGKSVSKNFYNAISKVGALVEGPAFYEHLSAEKNLEIFGYYSGGVSQSKIKEVLQLLGLYERRRDKVRTYSLGMKQRLGIAQALLNNPELIILDEPTNGLDPDGINDIRNLLLRLAKEKKITIFISSHILSEIQELCNKILIINNGKMIMMGNTKELLCNNDSIYIIESKDKEKLLKIINSIDGVTVIDINKNKFDLGRNKPEEILNKIMKQKIAVIVFEKYKLKLEDFYFNVVRGDQ